MKLSKLTGYAIPAALTVACVALAMGVQNKAFVRNLEHKTIDWRLRFRAPDRSVGKSIVVILIDEAALQKHIYRSPVSRSLLAELVSIADVAGSSHVVLDIFLKNPTVPAEDAELVKAMKRCGRVAVVSELQGEEGAYKISNPHPMFAEAAAMVGVADFPIDQWDQKVRRSLVYYDTQDGRTLSLSAALYRQMHKSLPDTVDPDGSYFINYQRPSRSDGSSTNVIPVLPASAVIMGLIPKDWLRDKVVFIGAGWDDNPDAYRTPFYCKSYKYALMPGVEIHANALATIESGKMIQVLSPRISLLLVLLLCLIFLTIERGSNALVSSISLPVMSGIYAMATLYCFAKSGIALPIATAFVALVLTYIALTAYRSLTEGKQKRWIKSAFQRYVSADYVNMLMKEPGLLSLGGEEREITIIFTDIEGFATMAERMTAVELVKVLNEYLGGMTEIVMKNLGTLDKYEGDAVIAFWNAPIRQADHARRAAMAAVEMAGFSRDMDADSGKQRHVNLRTRIGVNTGKMIVGNIGTKDRVNYTVIGDEANLAARLQHANKLFGTGVIISESTRKMLGEEFVLRELGTIRAKGREKNTTVFELICHVGDARPAGLEEKLGSFKTGLEAYRAGDWNRALSYFSRVLAVDPNDGPAKMYLRECHALLRNPPDGNWDGVFDTTSVH